MKNKGFTFIELLTVGGILVLISCFIFSFGAKHVIGNKQIIDFNRQNFAYASILVDDGKWEKCKIKAWKDWDRSDSIQIVFEDDSYLYTHLRNVKLSNK